MLATRFRAFSVRAVLASFIVSAVLPVGGVAAAPMGVTKGAFLRDAISTLRIPMESTADVPYTNVPADLQPYVQAAEALHALTPLVVRGKITWDEQITRGQALALVQGLLEMSPRRPLTRRFSDITTPVQRAAVSLALQDKWLRPMRGGYFGWSKPLSQGEGRTLLAKAVASSTVRIIPPEPRTYEIIPKDNGSLPKQDVQKAVWQLLNKHYLYRDRIQPNEAGFKSVEGLVNSLNDPYTVFYRPSSAKEFQTQLKGEVTGIGAQVEQKGSVLIIVAPLNGSPAQKAGLQPGDEILSVNGDTLAGLSYEDAVSKVRGPQGSVANLRIRRNGMELDVAVTRDLVRIADLDVSMQGTVVIATLHQFGEKTMQTFRAQMEELAAKNPTGIVLDLRNNPGGLLDAAGVVLSAFLPAGSPYVEIYATDGVTEEKTQDEPIFPSSLPLVVLVNKGSASASEIVAGALQDAKRATLVGETTFGKGTVQQLLEFSDGSSLKMTIAEWRTPGGRKIDGIGVVPDIIVAADTNRDMQLSRALELLR